MSGTGKIKSLVTVGGRLQWRRLTDEADNTVIFRQKCAWQRLFASSLKVYIILVATVGRGG